jgi:hypothetical protein
MYRREDGAGPRVRRCAASKTALARVFCASQLLFTACGLSELEGLSDGKGKNAGGSAQAGGRAGSADAFFADGESTGGAGGGIGGGGSAGSGIGGGDEGGGTGGGETDGGNDEAPAQDVQADAPSPIDGSCPDGDCMCPLGRAGPNCDTTGLALYWTLDEMSGVVTNDSSGNGLTGAYVAVSGQPTPAPGNVPPSMAGWDPGSLSFQGTTLRQAVFLTSTTPNFELVKPANNMTVSVWYKANVTDLDTSGSELLSLGDHYILRLGKSSTQYRIEFNKHVLNSATPFVYTQCWHVVSADTGIPPFLDGNWHHVAATSSTAPPGMAIYFDGTPIPCEFAPNNNAVYAAYDIIYGGLGQDLWLARHGNLKDTFDFQGSIDDVRIYDRVLSLQEIQALAMGTHLPP